MKKSCFLFAIVIWACLPLYAQKEKTKVDSIPALTEISRINIESRSTYNFLEKTNADQDVRTIVNLLMESSANQDSISSYLSKYANLEEDKYSLRGFEIKLSELKLLKIEAESQLKLINETVEEFSEDLKNLNVEEIKWEKTIDYLNSEQTTELSSVLNNIQELLLKVKQAKKELLKNYNHILDAQNRQNILISEVESAINDLDIRLEEYRSIIRIDGKPIWEIRLNIQDLISDLGSDIKALLIVMHSYVKNSIDIFTKYPVILLIFSFLFFYLRKYYLKVLPSIKENKKLNLSEDSFNKLKVFKRPFSISVLLSTLIFFYIEELPIEITELAILIMVIPILLILKERTNSIYYKYILYVLFLFFIQTSSEILLYTHSLSRFINLVIGVTLVFILVYLYKKIRKEVDSSEFPYKGLILVMVWLFIPLFCVAIIANVIGSIFLSETLFFSSLTSLYSAFVYSICFLITTQIINLFSYGYVDKGSKVFIKKRERLTKQIHNVLFITFFLIWLNLVLELFRIDAFVYGIIENIFSYSFTLGSVELVPANLIVLVFVIWATFKLSNFIRELLENDILNRFSLPRGMGDTISMLTRYSVLVIGFIIAIMAAGIKLDKLAIIIGGLGVGIGFGLQNIINNFISGLILAFERPIKIGDIIQMGDLFGTVKEIGIRSSSVRTLDGAEVIVPNGNLISNELINWTLSDKHRRLDLRIGVAYGTNPDKVLKILQKAMTNHEKIMDEPPPKALFIGFGDSSLDFRLLFWTNDFENRWQLESDINVRINNELAKAGIEIPFPQRDLHLRSVAKDINLTPPTSSKK